MPDESMEKPPITPKKLLVIIIEVILVIIIAMTAVGLVQLYWFAPFSIKGSSMEDTLYGGDKVYINKAVKTINRGDIVVSYIPSDFGPFDSTGYWEDWWEYTGDNDDTQRCPASRTKTFDDFLGFLPFVSGRVAQEQAEDGEDYYLIIKRVVAVPGDTVEIDRGILYINGERDSRAGLATYKRDYPLRTMGKDEYFVLGDNREPSHDSHSYGPIRRNWIYGKVVSAFSKGKLVNLG